MDPVIRSARFSCNYSTVVKTALSQMSFHDCGFSSRHGFDSQPVLSSSLMTEATKTAVRAETGLARSNMRVCGHRIQPPGVRPSISQRDAHDADAARGSFGIDTHSHRSDFCESAVFTTVL